ncbi:MAG: NAD/NADP octopine/nopaline dehydrogenase family protein [Bacteroidaceae bacterium]|nr:NAD/NADP octopine/nopaline dehydrogenase family protein [Bacteroidaceae bacterium]
MTTICICGGGSLGHVVAGYLGAKENVKVNILTRKPDAWRSSIEIFTPENRTVFSHLNIVSQNAEEVVADADIVILCLPGYAIKDELFKIRPFVKRGAFVGTVFSSTGFFFEALNIFDESVHLWGFQRVPFIARTREYGRSASLLGYKAAHSIAIENCDNKEKFRLLIEALFDRPVRLLNNHYEASFTNSNPILHPARLYSLFCDWNENVYYDHQFLFYEEWNNSASDYLISLDRELFAVLEKLPVAKGFLVPILEYYEAFDAESLTKKINSIDGFKGIKAPMIHNGKGWQPDLRSRYFQEDFMYGLRYIYETAHKMGIYVPTVDKIYNWGINMSKRVDK